MGAKSEIYNLTLLNNQLIYMLILKHCCYLKHANILSEEKMPHGPRLGPAYNLVTQTILFFPTNPQVSQTDRR